MKYIRYFILLFLITSLSLCFTPPIQAKQLKSPAAAQKPARSQVKHAVATETDSDYENGVVIL